MSERLYSGELARLADKLRRNSRLLWGYTEAFANLDQSTGALTIWRDEVDTHREVYQPARECGVAELIHSLASFLEIQSAGIQCEIAT